MFFSGEDLPTTEFKLFDNVTDLLKSVSITLLFALIVRDYLHMKETWENETIIICGFNFFGMSECSDTFGKIFFVSFRFCFVFFTRNVALSNKRTSSASMICAKFLRFVSSCCTFGISWYTILDQACNDKTPVRKVLKYSFWLNVNNISNCNNYFKMFLK